MLEKRTQMDNTLRLMELVADELKEASNIMVDSALASPSQLRLWLKEVGYSETRRLVRVNITLDGRI